MEKKIKKPMSNDTIYKVMMLAAVIVGAIFLFKNIAAGKGKDTAVVGISLVVFTVVAILMQVLRVAKDIRQFIVCIFIVLLVFIISINSGDYYSDDFPLYLAVIGIAGLYMKPIYTIIQMVLIDILLIVAYNMHPEKADPKGQYMMCVIVFSVAAITFFMAIKRGCAYTIIAEAETKEAEELLKSMQEAGEKLQVNCENSTQRVKQLQEANRHLEDKTYKLQEGSREINNDTQYVVQSFANVKVKMQKTEESIGNINNEIKDVESSMNQNKEYLDTMADEMKSVHSTFTATNNAFRKLEEQIMEIKRVSGQLGSISYNTTILALNATIESARAGEAGKGFEVVANNVQHLAKDSNECTDQVLDIIEEVQNLIKQTSEQLTQSTTAINKSLESLNGFQGSFEGLATNFKTLYDNIEMQTVDVKQMDGMVEQLKSRIGDMSNSSLENQDAVSDIASAMNVYKQNINSIINDTRQIGELSNAMLRLANK